MAFENINVFLCNSVRGYQLKGAGISLYTLTPGLDGCHRGSCRCATASIDVDRISLKYS